MKRNRKTVRHAEQGNTLLGRSRWSLKGLFLRRFRRVAPSISELLPPPDFLEHPFSRGPASFTSWYALLVPTHEEGDEVLQVVPRLLANQAADFTVLVAFGSKDSTAASITLASSQDDRIIPVPSESSEPTDLNEALLKALRKCEERRGYSVTDAMIVPLPLLEIKK